MNSHETEIAERTRETMEEMYVNMGPQHPSTHGVLRLLLKLDGEVVTEVIPYIGYLHRCHEKIGENRIYTQIIPYTDRLDYLASMYNNWGFVLTMERHLGVAIPERAEYMRVILGELQRIASHLIWLGPSDSTWVTSRFSCTASGSVKRSWICSNRSAVND